MLVRLLADIDVVLPVAQHAVDEPRKLSGGGEDGHRGTFVPCDATVGSPDPSTRLERHDGRPEVTGNVLFVSEPYGFTESMARDLERLRELTGLRWQLESNAWWSPGQTVRILILPGEGEARSMREIYAERRTKFREELAAIWTEKQRGTPAGAELVSGQVHQ